jgi:hypothetical protein
MQLIALRPGSSFGLKPRRKAWMRKLTSQAAKSSIGVPNSAWARFRSLTSSAVIALRSIEVKIASPGSSRRVAAVDDRDPQPRGQPPQPNFQALQGRLGGRCANTRRAQIEAVVEGRVDRAEGRGGEAPALRAALRAAGDSWFDIKHGHYPSGEDLGG